MGEFFTWLFGVILFCVAFTFLIWCDGGTWTAIPGEFVLNGKTIEYESYMCVRNVIELYDVSVDGMSLEATTGNGTLRGPFSCEMFDIIKEWGEDTKGEQDG